MPHPSSPRLLALHGLRLRGTAEVAEVADYFDADAAVIGEVMVALHDADLVTYRHGRIPGYRLTPDGTAEGEALLAEELDAAGARDRVQGAYEAFLGFNRRLLGVCTRWQLRDVDGVSVVNDHADADHDAAVVESLEELDALVRPVLATLVGALDRFAGHERRLRTALAHVQAGDHDWFTKPLFPSYHSVWFELHEDLLATLGTDRSSERRT